MAATVIVNEHNGASGTKTDKTSGTVRFKNADDATVDLNDPLVKPAAGQEYSYEKWLRLAASGEFTQISNLRAYSDGANGLGTGVKCWYAITGTYIQPVVPNQSADPPQSAAAGSPVENMADLFGLTSGSPGDLDGINTGPFTPLSPNADVQDVGDFLVLVMEVETTASSGLTPTETLTFAWDEILMDLENAAVKLVDGAWTAAAPGVGITVDSDADMALFKRRALQPHTGQRRCLLVAELDGVKTYVQRDGATVHIVVTRSDVWPTFQPPRIEASSGG